LETSFETRRPSPIAEPALQLKTSTIDFIKDELNLIRLEFKHQLSGVKNDSILLIACATLAGLSVLPLLAAAVIGLGWLMNGAYGWSALIVGLVCAIAGGAGAYVFAQRLSKKDFSFPHSRAALQGGLHDYIH
jgi:hypothetical protein